MPEANVATAAEPAPPDPSRRIWRNEYLWAAVILSAMTLVFFNPVFRHDGSFSAIYAHQRTLYPWVAPGDTPIFGQHDQGDYVYPRQVFLDRSIKREGQIPLWDPLTWAGHPFFAETGSRIAYPPFLLLTLLFSPILMHDVYLMLHVFAAGMAMFALMKELRTRFGGALLAGVAWAFCSYALLYYVLEMYAGVAALLPVVVLFVHRWHERRSWPSLLTAGVFLGLLYLGTSAELALLAYLAVVGYAGGLALRSLVRDRATLGWRGALGLLAAPGVLVGLAVAIGAVGIFPFLDLSARSGRVPLAYDDIMRTFPHLRVTDFARVFFPPSTPLGLRGVPQQVFLGTATALLALVGFFTRRSGTALARALVVVVFLVAVGGPATWVAYHLPGISKLHGVGRSFFLFSFGLAILAGFGLDRVVRRRPDRRALAVGITTVCVLTAFAQLFTYGRAINVPFQPRDPRFLLPPTPATEAAQAVLDATPGGGRVLPVFRQGVEPDYGYTLPAATGMALNLPVTGGYEPVLPEQIASMWRVLTGEKIDSVLGNKFDDTAMNARTAGALARVDLMPRFGVSAVLGPPTMPEMPGWGRDAAAARGLRLTYTGPDGAVYEVLNRNPRAFVVHQVTWTESPRESLIRFESPQFDVRREVLLDAADRRDDLAFTPGPPDRPADVHWLDDDPNGLVLTVDSPTDGWLVLLDSWDPGWRATIDGRSTAVLRADYGFRAVRIGAGVSKVRFSYRPTPVVVGAVVSGVSTAAVLGVLAAGPVIRRRKRRE